MTMTNRRSIALAAMILPALACSVPTGEHTEQGTEALCKGTVCTGPIHHPLPPLPPIGIPPASIVVTSDELDTDVSAMLQQTHLSVDTTETAPELFGPPTTYTNPAYTECQNDKAQCYLEPPYQRPECLDEVAERCADVPETITTAAIEYSYLQFGAPAKLVGAEDVFFPLTTLHHSGTFSFDFDVNYIHATVTNNVRSGFFDGGAWIELDDIQSNTPTINLEGSYPDVTFTNMKAKVSLNGLAPTPDGQSLDYASVSSTFDFDWDVNVIPDWLVDDFVDVRQITQNRVTTRLNNGFGSQKAHAALSKALTDLVARDITMVSPAGYASLGSVSMSGLDLVVTYTPK